jgi:uncharacterized protein YigE (DUF2233 family)
MLRILRRAAAAALLSAPLATALSAAVSAAECRRVTAEGEGYAVCTADLARDRLRLYWRDAQGRPYESLSRLAAAAPKLAFAMNAGMYDPDLAPVGLYVEDGREVRPANRANGPGNFHLKPNGIFYVGPAREGASRAGVLETGRYLRLKPRTEFATQSGPMLVLDGRIHPRISEDGPSRKIRNGVGVRDGGRVAVFAISDRPVSFGAFARLFKDELGCANALYLDGSVSALHAPALNRADASFRPLGPLVGALAR